MNREEILNMPAGFEMDALVAEKVMGWHVATEWRDVWHDAEGRFQHPVSKDDVYTDDEDIHLIVWHPSESILWAWDVIEKIKRMWNISYLANESVWQVSFIDIVPLMEVEADTAPLAICRAALLVVLDE